MKRECRYIPGGTRGPFGYHNPLPATAPRWRKLLRRAYDNANDVLYWVIPWV